MRAAIHLQYVLKYVLWDLMYVSAYTSIMAGLASAKRTAGHIPALMLICVAVVFIKWQSNTSGKATKVHDVIKFPSLLISWEQYNYLLCAFN